MYTILICLFICICTQECMFLFAISLMFIADCFPPWICGNIFLTTGTIFIYSGIDPSHHAYLADCWSHDSLIIWPLMWQAHAWELESSMPSILTAVELNLRMPLRFILLAVLPIFVLLVLSLLTTQWLPPVTNFLCLHSLLFDGNWFSDCFDLEFSVAPLCCCYYTYFYQKTVSLSPFKCALVFSIKWLSPIYILLKRRYSGCLLSNCCH